MVDMHGHATDRITMRTSNALLSAESDVLRPSTRCLDGFLAVGLLGCRER
jgi:hypothetical protein